MEERKARLAALAAKAGRAKPEPENEQNTSELHDHAGTSSRPTLKFRNYTPADPHLAKPGPTANVEVEDEHDQQRLINKRAIKRARSGREEDNHTRPEKSILEKALEQARREVPVDPNLSGAPELTMAPKKINWDLKRAIQPKLDKLEKRTQKAIVHLLKERLEREAASAENID